MINTPLRLIPIALLGSVFLGCSITTPDLATEPLETQRVAAEPKLLGACNPTPCVKILFDPLPSLSKELSPEARAAITKETSSVLYAPLDSEERQETIDLVMAELQERFDEFVNEGLSDITLDWEFSRTATVLFENPDVITIDIVSQGYLGGAHGFNDRTLLTFNARDGRRLSLDDIIDPKSRSMLQTIVEAEFRRTRQIPVGRSLAEAGFFMKPGDPILVPSNFGITPMGLLLQYNPYEIAPYVFGPTEVIVPKEAFQGLLSSESRHLTDTIDANEKQAS